MREGDLAKAFLLLIVVPLAFFYTGSAYSVLTDHVLEIREGGLFESTPFSESLFIWPSIIKVVCRPGFVAAFFSARQAHVIPTKAFESKAHLAHFVASITEKKRAGP